MQRRYPMFRQIPGWFLGLLHEDRLLAWLVFGYALAQFAFSWWDIPGSHSWENDGVSPRGLLAGLGNNFTPGKGHTYPPFHYIWVAILSLPILLAGLFTAPDWSGETLQNQMISVPVMTGIALCAKLIAVVMGSLSLLLLARIARRLFDKAVGRIAVLFAMTALTVSYYGRAVNLDGPYMFWALLAFDRLLSAGESGSPRNHYLFAGFAAAAIATKDQAYAGFILPVLFYLVLRPHRSAERVSYFMTLARSAGIGLATLAVLGGALFNPTGFMERIAKLRGTYSQDWENYTPGLAGLIENIRDIAILQFDYFWPWYLLALAWLGILLALRVARGNRPLETAHWRLLPLIAALSHLLFFVLAVKRAEHRFLLPLGIWLSVYGAVAVVFIGKQLTPMIGRRAVATVGAILMLLAALNMLRLPFTQWRDARRTIETILAATPPGTRVETYGLLVYLPHFSTDGSAPYRVERLVKQPLHKRNPLYGAREIEGHFSAVAERHPDILVIPASFADRFRPKPGAYISRHQAQALADADATAFFNAALDDRLPGYRLRRVITPELGGIFSLLGMTPYRIHGSTGMPYYLLYAEN